MKLSLFFIWFACCHFGVRCVRLDWESFIVQCCVQILTLKHIEGKFFFVIFSFDEYPEIKRMGINYDWKFICNFEKSLETSIIHIFDQILIASFYTVDFSSHSKHRKYLIPPMNYKQAHKKRQAAEAFYFEIFYDFLTQKKKDLYHP